MLIEDCSRAGLGFRAGECHACRDLFREPAIFVLSVGRWRHFQLGQACNDFALRGVTL